MKRFRVTAEITLEAEGNPEVWDGVAEIFAHLARGRDKNNIHAIPVPVTSLAIDIEPVEVKDDTD